MKRVRRILLGTVCAVLASLGVAAPSSSAATDPLFVLVPSPPPSPQPLVPPPTGYLNGPCGLAVDSAGRFYVSDYYHRAVDIFSSSASYVGQPLAGAGFLGDHQGPVDDPCGLALDGAGTLYVNNYHRNVVRFPTPLALATGTTIDSSKPTGVAVDSAGYVYVDDRTYVAKYDAAGALVQQIGLGTLEEGYGVAVSRFPGTLGYVYVPDASTDTLKVYDPAFDLDDPVAEIDGADTPLGHFVSLRDSAVAVDRVTGEIYVADNNQPQYTEHPQATIHVFSSTGVYEGHLKYDVGDASPPGLAVDNSAVATQGRVYVTSGNTTEAGIYAYPPGAATMSETLPPPTPMAALSAEGGEEGSKSGDAGGADASAAVAPSPSAAASEIAQKGTLRVSVGAELRPRRLPRHGTAPIAVSVGGKIATTDASLPPQLKRLRIELNRHGRLDHAGLPSCDYRGIQPGSSARALSACRSSLVGKGSFTANITLAGQEPYPTEGRLLIFNGARRGKPVLYGHIYAPRPFATSFVIVFAVQRRRHGTYGTVLDAPMPKAMDAWGRLTGLQMTLSRRYSYRGARHSFISAGCPAPKGFLGAVFPLAQTSFSFAGGQRLSSVLDGTCKVRR